MYTSQTFVSQYGKTKAVDFFFKKANSSGVDQYNLIIAIIEFII